MADESDDEKLGEVHFTPCLQVWKYLGWLFRNTVLGKNENDVARQILIERLAIMRREYYQDGQKSLRAIMQLRCQ
jgi:hypothetical protein